MTPTYSGEVQFAGYSDSSRSGPRITLRLSDREDLTQFVGCEGKRYMIALVEIGADEKPVQPQVGPLCQWVAIRCKEPRFQQWVVQQTGGVFSGERESWAAEWVRKTCGVESRADIDGNQLAENRLHQLVRLPYSAWLGQMGAR